MGNDLISRKAAIKAVKRIIQAGLPEEAIYAELEEIPTAYNVDSVCKELEKRAERANRRSGKCEGLGKFSEAFLNNLEFNTIIEDIKTVRNGWMKV